MTTNTELERLKQADLQDRARTIARIIAEVPVEDRAQLFRNVGMQLKYKCQNFTGTLFFEIASLS